jgi:hypothetical protein
LSAQTIEKSSIAMSNIEVLADYEQEFDRQLENLIERGYAGLAGITNEEFRDLIAPLRSRVHELNALPHAPEDGRIAFVIVIKRQLVASSEALSLVTLKSKPGIVSMYPATPDDFNPIDEVEIPSGSVYILAGIDRGKETLNVTPDQAMVTIIGQGRSPLTIDEGIAVLTQFPEFLKRNNCFSLLASRRDDRRVPALWISEGRSKLGWCWAGNPHTWLGSASCERRLAD